MEQRTFRSRNDFSHLIQQLLARMKLWILVVILLLQQMKAIEAAMSNGDNCLSKNKPGICRAWGECPVLKALIENGEYTNSDVVNCSFSTKEELICCPVISTETKIETSTDENKDRFTDTNSPTTKTDTDKTNTDRPAVRACRRIDKGLTPKLSQSSFLSVSPPELGEFPHMVGIGYSSYSDDDKPAYAIRCGGSLIDKRFVLTAAHCVSDSVYIPSIVRLGVVNLTDVNQMKDAVEVKIKEIHIHNDYLKRSAYNDIAILELERDVEYSEYVYPVCVYTDEKDPDPSIKLWVSGWGTLNTTSSSPKILLKAPLHTSPLQNCNKTFAEYGALRSLPEGIISSQVCAEVRDHMKNVCQPGSGGGHLQLVVDEVYNKYRLVGIVSVGFNCGVPAPDVYTRVASFLDFIEKIVWPNGGD